MHLTRVLVAVPALVMSATTGQAQSTRSDSGNRPTIATYFNPPELPASRAYSHAVAIEGGHLVYVSGQQALDPRGRLVGRDDFKRQAEQVFTNVRRALTEAGADISHVVAIHTHYVDRADLPAYLEARNAFFAGRSGPAPTSTTVQVSGLVADGARLEVGVTAVVPPHTAAAVDEPIAVVATVRARDGRAEQLQELLRSNAAKSRLEPGCLSYVIYRSLDDSNVFVLQERWATRDALAAHFGMPYMKDLVARREQLIERSDVMVLRRID